MRLAPEPDYRIDVDGLLERVDSRTRLVFVANPASPTGTWIGPSDVERLHRGLPADVLLVLDGAYAEFPIDPGYSDGLELARTSSNLMVTRIFSKLHGLAALRVGWAYAPAPVVDALERIRLPFNVNALAQLAAVAALEDLAFQTASVALVEAGRAWLAAELARLELQVVGPAGGNFLLVGFPQAPGRTAGEADVFLMERGLIVRTLSAYGLPDHLRITIGCRNDNERVVHGLSEFLRAR